MQAAAVLDNLITGRMTFDLTRLTHLTRALALILLLLPQTSWGILCLQCKGNEIRCTETEPVECKGPDEMCFKELIEVRSSGRLAVKGYELIQKGCKKYEEGDPTCKFHPDAAPPYGGHRCWCNDQDLCNASRPLIQNSYWMTLTLVTALPFIFSILIA